MFTLWQESIGKRQLILNNYISTINCRTRQQTTNRIGTIKVNNRAYNISATSPPVFTGNERSANPEAIATPYNLKIVSFSLNYYIADPTLWNNKDGAANQK